VDAQNTVDHMSPIVPITDAVQVVDLAEENRAKNNAEHAAENNAENHGAIAESEEEHSSLSDSEVDLPDLEADSAGTPLSSPRAPPDPEADLAGTPLSLPCAPTLPSDRVLSASPSTTWRARVGHRSPEQETDDSMGPSSPGSSMPSDPAGSDTENSDTSKNVGDANDDHVASPPVTQPPSPPRTRLRQGISKPKKIY
jgi:hypothetical protein